MRSHFENVKLIRAAIIAGDVNKAVAPARGIAEMQGVDTLPPVWKTSVRELQAAATRIRQSPDLPEAAAATADIGTTCGGCHTEAGGPSAPVGEPPVAIATVSDRMKRHRWATERLWDGLVVPSDDAWNAGAAILTEAPWSRDVVAAGGVHGKALADRFTKLGNRAQTAKGEERAEVYASLLATCSPCHAHVRKD